MAGLKLDAITVACGFLHDVVEDTDVTLDDMEAEFGPEGGISPEEIEAFESKGGLKIGLGPRIMRAETAPLYALSSTSYALELMK